MTNASMAQIVGWCISVLQYLGDSSDADHVVGPVAWAMAEGGWSANAATYNCWNTTLDWPGATSINPVGVKSYPSLSAGVDATVLTLRNLAAYVPVCVALSTGDPRQLAQAVGASPWGTPGPLIESCIAQATAVVAQFMPTSSAPTEGDSMFGDLASSKQDNFNASVKVVWDIFRTDQLTDNWLTALWNAYSGEWDGSIFSTVSAVIDQAGTNLRPFFKGAV